MAHQITLTLTDAEYSALEAEAVAQGEAPESLARQTVVHRLGVSRAVAGSYSRRLIEEHLLRTGVITVIPPGKAEMPDEALERERLARLFAVGQPVSEIVIEARGPR